MFGVMFSKCNIWSNVLEVSCAHVVFQVFYVSVPLFEGVLLCEVSI